MGGKSFDPGPCGGFRGTQKKGLRPPKAPEGAHRIRLGRMHPTCPASGFSFLSFI